MRKGRSIIGLRVIGQGDGRDLGTVKDLVFDHEISEVLAILISEKDLFGLIDAQVIPWNEVRVIGPDAVMVPGGEAVIRAGEDPHIHHVLSRQNSLVGKHIHTEDGRNLGAFSDIFLDDSGRISGYEVSGGILSDAVDGRYFMPVPSSFVIGDDVAVVPSEVAAQMEAHKQNAPGGLRGAAAGVGQSVGESVSGAYASAGEAVSGAYAATRQRAGAAYEEIAGASVEKQQAFVIGKTASRDVVIPAAAASETAAVTPDAVAGGAALTGDTISELGVPTPAAATDIDSAGEVVAGEVLVRQGEIITAAHATRAADAGVLHQLVLAAVTPSGDTLESGAGTTSEGLAQGAATVKEGAANLWEKVKSKAGELTEAAQHKKEEYAAQAEQARINTALGRPTTRVILDQQDNVILNTGELITHAAVERARAAGALDLLLDSVYTTEPEIAPEMQRATEPGEAALEHQAQPAQPAPPPGGSILTPVSPDGATLATDTAPPDTAPPEVAPPEAAPPAAAQDDAADTGIFQRVNP